MSDWQRRREARYDEAIDILFSVFVTLGAAWVIVKLAKLGWRFVVWCWG